MNPPDKIPLRDVFRQMHEQFTPKVQTFFDAGQSLNSFFSGQGIPRGVVIGISGRPASGVTSTLLAICKTVCENGHPVVYLDGDGRVNEARLKDAGLWPFVSGPASPPGAPLFSLLPTNSLAEIGRLLDALHRQEPPAVVIVIDSLSGTRFAAPSQHEDGETGYVDSTWFSEGSNGDETEFGNVESDALHKSHIFSNLINKAKSICRNHQMTLFVANFLTDGGGPSADGTPSKPGAAYARRCDIQLDLKRKTSSNAVLTRSTQSFSIEVSARENKFAPQGRAVTLDFGSPSSEETI